MPLGQRKRIRSYSRLLASDIARSNPRRVTADILKVDALLFGERRVDFSMAQLRAKSLGAQLRNAANARDEFEQRAASVDALSIDDAEELIELRINRISKRVAALRCRA